MTADNDQEKIELPHEEFSVPVEESVGYMHCGVDPACDPIEGEGYWVPVANEELAEVQHPPRGHVIQYPKDDREPHRVGDKEVPDHVTRWGQTR